MSPERPFNEAEEIIEEIENAIIEGDEEALEAEGVLEHEQGDHAALKERNIAVACAAFLFLLSFFMKGKTSTLVRGLGYFCGAAAYFSEIRALTDGFTKKIPHREAFMAYCFGPLYILMGIAYLLE